MPVLSQWCKLLCQYQPGCTEQLLPKFNTKSFLRQEDRPVWESLNQHFGSSTLLVCFCVTMHLLCPFPNSQLRFSKSFLIRLHTIKLLPWTNHVHKFALLIVQNTVLQEPSVLHGSWTALREDKMVHSNGWPIYDGKTNPISITALIRMTHENWNLYFSIGQNQWRVIIIHYADSFYLLFASIKMHFTLLVSSCKHSLVWGLFGQIFHREKIWKLLLLLS